LADLIGLQNIRRWWLLLMAHRARQRRQDNPPWTGQASERHPVRFIAIRSHRQCDWPGL